MDWLKLSLIVAGIIAGLLVIVFIIIISVANNEIWDDEKLNPEERDKDLYN